MAAEVVPEGRGGVRSPPNEYFEALLLDPQWMPFAMLRQKKRASEGIAGLPPRLVRPFPKLRIQDLGGLTQLTAVLKIRGWKCRFSRKSESTILSLGVPSLGIGRTVRQEAQTPLRD